ncbi:MAG: aminopeptidase P N-terminal domain-containing protein [Ignavibacteriales bacterium]|nr:aminopeptidase P N-terminal domain-containing protein [Ignavibacteriales bacterium]
MRLIKILMIVLLSIFFEIAFCQNDSFSISQNEYAGRRQQLLSSLDSGTVVVMRSGDYKMRSNDVEYRYRQESNFLYLTGWRSTNRYIIFSPAGFETDGKRNNVFLFTTSQEESKQTKIGTNEIICNISRFQELFKSVLTNAKTLYISAPDLQFVNDWLNDKKIFLDKNAKKELEQRYPDLKVKNALPLFGKFREIKSEAELRLMQKSIVFTWNGLKRAMMDCKPDTWEYELQADIEYEMMHGGADFPSWTSIIGSGENSLILHYDDNRRQMKNGDLVVMDVGAEYDGYACDITRTIPVSGKFTKAQTEVYNIVLKAQEEVIKIVKPGITMKDMDAKAKEVIVQAGFGKFIRHGVTHPVGIDVHDIWASDTLRAGMVMTVEPGIYIPTDADSIASDFRGFGIRIEDDVLVTESGCEVMTKNVPKEIDEIERLMRKK